MKSSKSVNIGMLALFMITGAVLGGIVGEIVASSAMFAGITPFVVKNYLILDLPPVTVNLYVIKFVVGFTLSPNLISILGVIAAILLFRKF